MSAQNQKPTKKPRRVKTAKYRSFRLSKRLKNTRPKLPNAWTLATNSFITIKQNWKLFGGISLIYALLLIVLTRGFGAGGELVGTKELLQEVGNTNNTYNSFLLFSNLLSGNSGIAQSETAGLFQMIIVLISSLAFVWAFRQTYGKKVSAGRAPKIRMRDAFYKGMYPLVPVLLVLCVIGLQLLPVALSSGVYSAMIVSGLAVTMAEKMFWIFIVGLLIMLSLYLLGSSLIALLAATLPDVTPMEALRGAHKYVEHRRFVVIAKMLWLALGILLLLTIIVLPLIAFIPVIAELVFFMLSVLLVPFSIGYMYNLYRALLK